MMQMLRNCYPYVTTVLTAWLRHSFVLNTNHAVSDPARYKYYLLF